MPVGLTMAFPPAGVLLPSRAFVGCLVGRTVGNRLRESGSRGEQSWGLGAGAGGCRHGTRACDVTLGGRTALGSDVGGRPRLGV